jgi:hypothetical protein
MAKRVAHALLGLAAALGCACAPDAARFERIQVDPAARPTLVSAPFGDLVEQWVDAPGSLFVRRPRPDLGAYRALRFERPAIFYERSVAAPLVTDHSFLTRALASAVREELMLSIPLAETSQGGDGVLRVSAEVTELEFDRSKSSNTRVTSIVEPGRTATFVLQLTDDASGTPLVRIAARRPMPGGIFTGPWSADIDRSVQLFRAFAKDARESLAHVVRPVAAAD